MVACQDNITPILESFLACVTAWFDACEVEGFCRSGLVAGDVAWDDCCDCGEENGQLWVRLASWDPDPALPAANFQSKCNHLSSVLAIEVGALRCVPTIDDNGYAPSAEKEQTSAAQLALDAQLIYNAIMCCIDQKIWQGWIPLGSDGGCGGGAHLFTVPYFPCQCDDVGFSS